MRKLLLLLTLFFFTGFCFAQVQVKLVQPPPNQLRATDIWKLTLINTGKSTLQVTLNGTLEETREGILVEGHSKPISLPPGTKRITYDDVKTGNVNFKSGKWREAFTRTGNAPSGDYTICIHVKDKSGEEIGSDCINQRVEITSSPTLITPADGDSLRAGQSLVFTWSTPMPAPSGQITYKLNIVEILGNQSPEIAIQRNSAWFEKTGIRTTMFQYPISARTFENNKKYAWTVQCLNADGQGIGENNGMAQQFTFRTGAPNRQLRSLLSSNPNSTTTGGGTAAVGDTIKAGLNGEFKVIVSQVTTGPDSSLTGKGKVYVQWLLVNVAVEFKKIRIDTTKRLTSGGIVSSDTVYGTSYQAYPKAWADCLLSGPGVANVVDNATTWTNDHVDSIVSWVNNNVSLGQPVINYQSSISPPAIPNNSLKMPFGLQFNNGNQQLVITEMLFKPNESKINFLAQEKFTKSGTTYKLGFAGKYFLMHPNSIDFTSGRVELAEDFTLPNVSSSPKMKFTFINGSANPGCFAKWDSNGLDTISIALVVKFSRDWLLPSPPSPDSVKLTLTGNATSIDDVILTASFPSFEIVGTNGMKIQHDSISIDLSDIRNPANLAFPANYPNIPVPVGNWQGFNIPSCLLTLPDAWKTGTSPTQINASNIIIDDMGLTMKVKATNVITFKSCKVADLSASLDTIDISIIHSSLVNGSAKGKLVLPISNDSTTNSLKYTASFSQAAGAKNFQIVIVPAGPIDADVLKGTMTLDETSNITALQTPDSLTLSISLNGSFAWDNPDLSAPVMNIVNSPATRALGIKGIKMELDFEDMGMTYTHYPGNTHSLDFSLGNWSFASPQKLLANFPVSIKNIHYKSLTPANLTSPNKELLKGALMIDVIANLTDDIGGTTTLGAAFAIDMNTSTMKFTPAFKGVFIDSIAVHADMPAVKIDGYLKMYDHDSVLGDGFEAQLSVTFTAVSFQADALVQFGNTTYLNSGQYYRYWRVEADVMLPVGIPFLPGVGFYGFGGGAYYNMEAHPIMSTIHPGNYVYTFVPKKSTFGLMVKATVATMPKFETFNADVSLSATFNTNTCGLLEIDFLGNFWVAAKLAERANAKLLGGVTITYNFTTKVFDLNGALTINDAPTIATLPSTPLGVHLNINGLSNNWYFKCGTPGTPNTVKVFGANLYEYLMFGNYLTPDVPNGFTPRFRSAYQTATTQTLGASHDPSAGVGINTSTGKGFAIGAGVSFGATSSGSLGSVLCAHLSYYASISAGAELDLSLMQRPPCLGINGYRVDGDIGFYFALAAGVDVTGCKHGHYDMLTLNLGGWLQGRFPNPTFFAGGYTGHAKILHIIDVGFSGNFTWSDGPDCIGTAVTTTDSARQDAVAGLYNHLIQYVQPNMPLNFPIASPINVKYVFVPEQVFDVAENQGDGTIKNRTFKLVVNYTTLEVQNANGTWTLQILHSKVNNIGEWECYLNAPPVVPGVHVTQASNIITTALPTLLNTNNGNTLLASNGLIVVSLNGTSLIPATVQPPPQPVYPNPVPNPVNHLEESKHYRFNVGVTLMEGTGHVVGTGASAQVVYNWQTAQTRAGTEIVEYKTVLFRTPNAPVNVNNNTLSR